LSTELTRCPECGVGIFNAIYNDELDSWEVFCAVCNDRRSVKYVYLADKPMKEDNGED
jgi:uncharacterized Zn finger protein (UPF0148 family)